MMKFRTGLGYDVHRLVEDRPLILGGVTVPHSVGLLGHSDADVALHALSDALLGAVSRRDIGYHFPDSDQRYRGADSRVLLRRVAEIVEETGYSISNVDITIVAQSPKLSPFIDCMIANIASDLHLSPDDVSVKATTTERLGFEGREEGISALAVATVFRE